MTKQKCEICNKRKGIAHIKGSWRCASCWNDLKGGIDKGKMTKKKTVKKVTGITGSKRSIICTVCGEEKGVRPDVLQKRIDKYGSEDKLRKEYKCQVCRKK